MTKCNVSICHAACCGIVPIPSATFHANKHLLQRKVELMPFPGDQIVAVEVETATCGFLTHDYHCAIYDNRPEVCRLFARRGETHPMLKCEHLEGGVET